MKRHVPSDEVVDSELRSRIQRRRVVNTAVIAATAAAALVVNNVGAVATVVLEFDEKKPRVNRLARPSQYFAFYRHLSDAEFRKTFRVPRELFEFILQRLRPHLQYRYYYASSHIPSGC